MLDGGLHSLVCPPVSEGPEESVCDRALREYNEDGVFAVDTFIALRELGIDPDIYLAQLQQSNGVNVYEGEDIE